MEPRVTRSNLEPLQVTPTVPDPLEFPRRLAMTVEAKIVISQTALVVGSGIAVEKRV
jgi:hypothetical protein